MIINNISIIGGTHGNEYTGVYLIKKLRNENFHEKWNNININLIIGNPKAYEQSSRFVDFDLNRSFGIEDLSNIDLPSYEANRAKVINQAIGPKGNPKTDMIIDMHTTTSNMGISIILFNINQYNFQMASYIKSQISGCHVYYMPAGSYVKNVDHVFLNSIATYGFALEIGPIPNGIVRHDILKQMNMAIYAALEFVSIANSGKLPIADDKTEIYKHVKTVNFPMDEKGNINGFIHEDLQDQDYQPIQKGHPIFETLQGKVIYFADDGIFYPVFINEAAYYHQSIAFSLTEKKLLTVNRD